MTGTGSESQTSRKLEQVPYQDVPHQPITLPDRVFSPDYERKVLPDELYVPDIY